MSNNANDPPIQLYGPDPCKAYAAFKSPPRFLLVNADSYAWQVYRTVFLIFC